MLSPLPQTFVAIAETGSITAAADQLNLAKSAVSQNLKKLEEQLGVKLAIRTTRILTLTPAGEHYLSHCRAILALAQRASTQMEAFGAEPSGVIKLTAPHAMIAPLIAPALAQLVRRYPKLSPSLIADDQRLDLIAHGLDVAITAGRLADSSLKARKIGVLRDLLCVSPCLLKAHGCEIEEYQLRDYEAIEALSYISHWREGAKACHDLIERESGAKRVVHFTPSCRANTIEALIALAKEGLGVALLPDFAIRDALADGSLVQLFPDYLLPEKPVYAVHAYDRLPPKSVLAVIEAVQACLKP